MQESCAVSADARDGGVPCPASIRWSRSSARTLRPVRAEATSAVRWQPPRRSCADTARTIQASGRTPSPKSMGRRHRVWAKAHGTSSTHGMCPSAYCPVCSYLELKAHHVPVAYGRLTVNQMRAHLRRRHAVHLGGIYTQIRLVGKTSYTNDIGRSRPLRRRDGRRALDRRLGDRPGERRRYAADLHRQRLRLRVARTGRGSRSTASTTPTRSRRCTSRAGGAWSTRWSPTIADRRAAPPRAAEQGSRSRSVASPGRAAVRRHAARWGQPANSARSSDRTTSGRRQAGHRVPGASDDAGRHERRRITTWHGDATGTTGCTTPSSSRSAEEGRP